jgi:hypothetical protein
MANLKGTEKKVKETDVLRDKAKAILTEALANVDGWALVGDSKDGGIAVATNESNDIEVRVVVKKTRWGE